MHKLKENGTGYFLLLLTLLFCIFQYGIYKLYGYTIYQDEFGYWSNAAGLLHYDWSEVTSKIPYYSFGYSILLLPILYFVENVTIAYRIAILMNFIMISISAFCLWKTFEVFYSEQKKESIILISSCAILYPTWIVYAQTTLAEVVILTVFSVLCFLFSRINNCKRHLIRDVMTGILMGYLFWVHMRTIGVVIAGVIYLLMWMKHNVENKSRGLRIIGIAFAMILFGIIIKKQIILQSYGLVSSELLAANDVSGQINKIFRIFTFSGVVQFSQELISKMFYIVLASAGTIFWAIYSIVTKKIKFKKNERMSDSGSFHLFLFLSFFSELIISAIFMFGGGRVDHILYGRYIEFLFPILIAIGLIEMRTIKHLFIKNIILVASTGIGLPIIFHLIDERKADIFVGYFVVGISYLLNEKNYSKDYFFSAYLLGSIVILFVTFITILSKKYKNGIQIYLLLILLEITGGLLVSQKYNYSFNSVLAMDLQSYEEVMQENSEKEIYYVYENNEPVINSLQFYYKSKTIHLIAPSEISKINPQNSTVILDVESKYIKNVEEEYENRKRTSSFAIYY